MQRKVTDVILKGLATVSMSVAKRTVSSTTRFYNYQPSEDYKVLKKMVDEGLVDDGKVNER